MIVVAGFAGVSRMIKGWKFCKAKATYLFLWISFLDTHTAVKASSSKHSSFFLQFSGLHKSSKD